MRVCQALNRSIVSSILAHAPFCSGKAPVVCIRGDFDFFSCRRPCGVRTNCPSVPAFVPRHLSNIIQLSFFSRGTTNHHVFLAPAPPRHRSKILAAAMGVSWSTRSNSEACVKRSALSNNHVFCHVHCLGGLTVAHTVYIYVINLLLYQ